MEVNGNDLFHLALSLAGFYICYRAGTERALNKLIKDLQDAGVLKEIDDDDDRI